MPFKLTAAEMKNRDELVEDLKRVGNNLEQEIASYNEAMEELKPRLEEALTYYNESISTAKAFCDGIASKAEEDMGDKSEKWQESEKGQAVEEWKESWAGADFEERTIEFPDELDSDIPDNGATLQELPDEADTM